MFEVNGTNSMKINWKSCRAPAWCDTAKFLNPSTLLRCLASLPVFQAETSALPSILCKTCPSLLNVASSCASETHTYALATSLCSLAGNGLASSRAHLQRTDRTANHHIQGDFFCLDTSKYINTYATYGKNSTIKTSYFWE